MHRQRVHALRSDTRARRHTRWARAKSRSDFGLLTLPVASENVFDFLQGTPSGLRVPDPNDEDSSPVERDKAVEVPGPDISERNGRALCEDQVQAPIGRGSD